MPDLHITNGDGAANLLKASAVDGDVLVWRDPMHHGPFPAGDLDTISEIRARYLVGDGNDPSEAMRDFHLRNTHLRGFRKYQTVVLWFEHDLLDQLQILQILDWFSGQKLGKTRLRMVCIGAFPGMAQFRGLGELTPDQIATLDPQREDVTDAQLELAQQGWSAFQSPDPQDLAAFIAGDLTALPFLKAALQRHLQEYPWHDIGLTRSEAQVLRLVSQGVQSPVDIFTKNMDLEDAFFMGDWPTFRIIERLCSAGLLTCAPGPFWYPPWTPEDRPRFREQKLSVTSVGQQILDGEETAFERVPRDQWMGGVHLESSKTMWTWNDRSGQLQQRSP